MKKFTFATKDGSARILALCIVLILLFSCCAHYISTCGGQVDINRLTLDFRGASVDANLYYPLGTDSHDRLPAVIVAHGGGIAKGNMQGIAEELARRGMVVLNFSANGAGLSQQPNYDEFDMEPNGYSTPLGFLDCINYIRSLEFVDPTRIGIVGHSMGSWRAQMASITDCGNYTYNDILINILHDEFGLEFTEEEIFMDAKELAASRLDDEQLAYFTYLADEAWTKYDTRVRAICMMGDDGIDNFMVSPVDVAGHEILRNVQVNVGLLLSYNDHNMPAYIYRDRSTEYWHQTEEIEGGKWYVIDTNNQTGFIAGDLFDTTVANSPELLQAVNERTAREFNFTKETHSKNCLSVDTTGKVVEFFTQTLQYNNGELTDSATVPLDSRNVMFITREFMNFGALLSMIMMLIAFVSLVTKQGFFASCVPDKPIAGGEYKKGKFWLVSAATVVFGFIAMYFTNKMKIGTLVFEARGTKTNFLPFSSTWDKSVIFMCFMAAFSILILAFYAFTDKKAFGSHKLGELNLKQKPVDLLKMLLLAALTLFVGYLALVLVEYLFNDDFKFWNLVFTEMRAEYWGYLWRYFIILFPCQVLISSAINYAIRDDVPAWVDTLITVVVNSLGVWLLSTVNTIIVHQTDVLFSSFIASYSFLFMIPITVYINRKLYCITRSPWIGAAVNSLLISWSLISTCGISAVYVRTAFTNFWGM